MGRGANHSDKKTFVVEIDHTQNATWQGTVTWLDEDRKQRFRSALELLQMMEDVCNER